MKSSLKRLMAYLLVIFLVLGAFPLLSSSTGAESRSTRDAEVIIDNIGISNANLSNEGEGIDGKYELGNYNITIDFNATGMVEINMSVVTGIIGTGEVENKTFRNISSVDEGVNTTLTPYKFDFTAGGVYWVNVSAWNGTNNQSMNETYTFEDVYNLTVGIEGVSFIGDVSGGFYANDSLEIVATITNNGNKEITANITVNITVLNATNVIDNSSVVTIEGLGAGDEADASYMWTPSEEGAYAVNVTWNCTEVNGDAPED